MDPYDSLFYESICIPETHPETLAVLGRVMGLATADPATCRVLELGCATGGNLIPMAEGLPQARFLGIDLSGPQVESGNRLIARLAQDNVRLRQGDILKLDPESDPDLGPFDFIIAHGVYSWVPPAVQQRLLWLGRRLLAPGGIFYVSYNVLPGWRLRGTLRDILLDACRTACEPRARLAAAQVALERLALGLADVQGAAALLLREEVRRLREAPASYLYFEFLAEHHRPVLFRDFALSCAAAGLRYLCDPALHTLFPASLGASAEAALADLDDGLEVEQWLDFLGNRGFRQSLLIRDDAAAEEVLSLERFATLSLCADLQAPAKIHLGSSHPAIFKALGGERVEVSHPLTKAVVAALAGLYPDALALDSVLPRAQRLVIKAGGGSSADDLGSLLAELFAPFSRGAIQARLQPRRLGRALPERPRVRPLVRALVEDGHPQVPTRDHGNLDLDPLAAELIGLLDGSRDLAELSGFLGQTPNQKGHKRGSPAASSKSGRQVLGLIGLFQRYGLMTD